MFQEMPALSNFLVGTKLKCFAESGFLSFGEWEGSEKETGLTLTLALVL